MAIKRFKIIVVLFVFCLPHLCFALKSGSKIAKIELKKGQTIKYTDNRYTATHDTIILLPDSAEFHIEYNDPLRSEEIYNKLENKASKYKWLKEIHDIVLIPSSKLTYYDTLPTIQGEATFVQYEGRVIRSVTFKKLNVFGPTIYEPDLVASSWFLRKANAVHVKTRDRVLLRYLLFSKGGRVNPYTLADNERILRDLPFIEDARIDVAFSPTNPDSVDVVVITKDTWSKGFDINMTELNNTFLEAWDNNILGTGQENDFAYFYNDSRRPIQGLGGVCKIRNVKGSFIDAKVYYSIFGYENYGLNLSRSFITAGTKYAGELNIIKNRTYVLEKYPNDQAVYMPLSSQTSWMWLGRSFTWKGSSDEYRGRPSFIVSGGIFNYSFDERPEVSHNTNYEYHRRTLLLSSLAFSQQGFYKSNLVYSFGRTEDIPYGFLINLTQGIEKGEFYNRLYGNIKVSAGSYIGQVGYLYSSASFGNFLNRGEMEQGMLRLNVNYFTTLFVIGRIKFRQFFTYQYIKGYKRYKDELLYLNNYTGVRGLRGDSAVGTKKMLFNFELVAFLPHKIAGFRTAVYGFADVGLIGNVHTPAFSNTQYKAIGIGLRLRNERLVFKTIQLRFAIFPGLPKYERGEPLFISTNTRYKSEDFFMKGPEISHFR